MEDGFAADASTLIYLAKTDAFAEASEVLGVIRVTSAVWEEAVRAGEAKGAPDVARIRQALEDGHVRLVELGDREQTQAEALASRGRLGRGESETLGLVARNGVAIIDDARASRVAAASGIRAISTLLLPVIGRRTGRLDDSRARGLLHRLALVIHPRAEVLLAVENRLEEEVR